MKEIHCYRFEANIYTDSELVFECLNKDKHVLKWNTQIIENIYEGSENDLQEGATFITRQKIDKKVYELEAKYTKYDPPYNVCVETATKEGTSKTEYRLKVVPAGTELTVDVYLIPSNWMYKTFTNMFKQAFKHVYDDQFNNFIEYVYKVQKQRN